MQDGRAVGVTEREGVAFPGRVPAGLGLENGEGALLGFKTYDAPAEAVLPKFFRELPLIGAHIDDRLDVEPFQIIAQGLEGGKTAQLEI